MSGERPELERYRVYYRANRESCLARTLAYRAANRERVLARQRRREREERTVIRCARSLAAPTWYARLVIESVLLSLSCDPIWEELLDLVGAPEHRQRMEIAA